ncbi:hypothetical protein EDB89DRAFT_173942 [Lactarius sanguifluus]|nr:hypothetical protein EDB89DRAFT_173942 [Lactarius sanguifluus]
MAAVHRPPEGGAEHDVRLIRSDPCCANWTRVGPTSAGTIRMLTGATRRRGAEVEDSEEEDDGGMFVDQEIGADAMTAFVRLECPLPRHSLPCHLTSELPLSSSSAKELLEASSPPSAAGVPPTPSANSNSASTALPLLLIALSPSSSSSSASSRRILASSSKSPALTYACPATRHTLTYFAVTLLDSPSRIRCGKS